MRAWIVLAAVGACHRPSAETATDAAPVASITPIIAPRDGGLSPSRLAEMLRQDEEDEPGAATDAGACPLSIHPDYCRHRCRNFTARTFSMHARRMSPSRRAGKGRCGNFLVFAEEERGEDGGATGTLVEYFDATTNELLGAADSRRKPCGDFGQVPKCKLEIDWGPLRP